MHFVLKKSDLKMIRLLQKKERDTRRYKKLTVLVMLHSQYKMVEIELNLGLDDNTIRLYARRYEELGLESYLKDHYVGYSGKLTCSEELSLSDHLRSTLYTEAETICEYVKGEYGVIYSV